MGYMQRREAALTADSEEGNQPTPANQQATQLRGTSMATILFVEDHVDSLRLMTRLLSGAGYEVLPAASLAEARQLASTTPIDLLISDLGLPDGSGADLLRGLLHANGSKPDGLKAIAISGYDMEEDLRRSREAGFVRHVTKPVNFDVLMETIRELLG